MSLPRIVGALAGALATLLGLIVLVGWAIHSAVLIQVAPYLAPMQRNTAASFVAIGLALLGVASNRLRLAFIGSAIAAGFAGASILEYLIRANVGVDELLGAGVYHDSDIVAGPHVAGHSVVFHLAGLRVHVGATQSCHE